MYHGFHKNNHNNRWLRSAKQITVLKTKKYQITNANLKTLIIQKKNNNNF